MIKISFKEQRKQMVKEQLYERGIRDEAVLRAMFDVPRHKFIPVRYRHLSYADRPLYIGKKQTISQPFMVASMTELLGLDKNAMALEIGTGSGYQAAVLAQLVKWVYTVERFEALVVRARRTLMALGIENVSVLHADGSGGWPEHAPYDGVLVAAAAPSAPQPLLDQLAAGGRLVIPVGGRGGQRLQVWRDEGEGFEHREVAPVSFVPLRGEFGWDADDWERRDR